MDDGRAQATAPDLKTTSDAIDPDASTLNQFLNHWAVRANMDSLVDGGEV